MPGWGVEIVADTFTPMLARASQRMRSEVAQQMDGVGADMEELARELVRVRTGFLQSTIYHRVDESTLAMDFGATADYASFNEFGTRRMAAQPFIRPAFDANQQRLLDALLLGVMNAFR
jgi:HK97 gp10 family phage protein